ncbi:hypothetical protein CCP3SC1_170032 [Gammaproteobacteria bacterium]
MRLRCPAELGRGFPIRSIDFYTAAT